MATYVIGVDFGTESGRAVLVDVADGRQVATAVHPYANGVIDARLPLADVEVRLSPDWALQDPDDYLEVFRQAIPAVLSESGVDPADVVGVGIDFTACTMLPVKADGTPLSSLPEFRASPHAWVKLWKHHAAQPEADRINAVARATGQGWLDRYGGRISSEWFFSKALQILDEAPEIYSAADRLIEGADWVVWRLTGIESRNACTAGYKAMWSKHDGFPDPSYFGALDPRLANVIDEKMSRDILSMGQRAGVISAEAAAWTGLRPGTAVAVANVDAHVAVPAATVIDAGRMVMIMGTSTCHIVLSREERTVPGMCGYVEDGVVPGFFGYEAGQSCVGDHFNWFVEHAVPGAYEAEARARGIDIHGLLQEKAARLRPGESGLLALDWWNGNRSVLVDAELGGLLIGATPGHDRRGDLPGAGGGHGVRDAGDHRDVRGPRRADPGDRGLRGPRREESADHADLRRCHRPAVQAERVRPDPGPRLGDVRGRGRRRRGRRPSNHPGRGSRDGQAQGSPLRADRRQRGRVRPALSRIPPAARLLRPWRERRHEDASADSRRGRPRVERHGGPGAASLDGVAGGHVRDR